MVKAVRFSRFGGPEVLEIVDLPDPHPGPGEVRIAVRAAGVNASDWKKRQGLMDEELPQTLGHEAAGVVDELGEGVADVAVGDRVFGFSADGAAQAELAVLSSYAPIPPSLDFPDAAALPAAIETATRALDQLGVGSGSTLLINGASGSVGSAAVQLAVARGARVIGTASPANHDYLRSLGAEPVAYGDGLVERVRALAPDGVDVALDVAGSGVLPELIELAGGPEHVVTIADFGGAQEHGVRFSSGDAGRAIHALAEIGELIESGRFSLPVAQTFPLADVAEAHRVGRGRSRARKARAGGRGHALTRKGRPAWSPPASRPISSVPDIGEAREFYTDYLGLSVEEFDMGWVARFRSPDGRAVVQLVTRDATSPYDSAISVNVGDQVDEAYADAVRRGFEIVHPLTTEPWGIRRFLVRAPDGNVININSHSDD